MTKKIQVLERFGFARRVTNIAQSVVDRNKQPEAQWATVVARADDGRPTVAIDGGETVTCHSWAAEAYEGNRVTVEVRNHRAYLLTNETRPATDDATAIELDGETNERIDELEEAVGKNKEAADSAAKAAKDAADAAQRDAKAAQEAADQAKKTANATGQYFFHDSNGVHVSSDADVATGEANALLNSTGLLFRAVSTWLAQLTTSALAFYDGLGNAASNIVAQFSATSQRIGKESSGNIVVNPASILFRQASTWLAQLSSSALTFYDGNGNADANSTAQYTGDFARIGKLSKGHIVASGSGVDVYGPDGSDVVMSVAAERGKTSDGSYTVRKGTVDVRGSIKMQGYEYDTYSYGDIIVDQGYEKSVLRLANKLNRSSGYQLTELTLTANSFGSPAIELSVEPGTSRYQYFVLDGDGCSCRAMDVGKLTAEGVELSAASPYIDFHYNRSSADYTSRIIENASGQLNIVASKGLQVNGQALPVVKSGLQTATGDVESGKFKDYTISYGHTYSSAPNVVVCFNSSSVSGDFGKCTCSVVSAGKTSFTARVFNGDAVKRTPGLRWIAVGI